MEDNDGNSNPKLEKYVDDMYEGKIRPDCQMCDELTAKARNGEISKEDYKTVMMDLLSDVV
jgi:hypothetical protein